MNHPQDLSYAAVDTYMGERSGRYEWRAVRYRAAAEVMHTAGLNDADTVCDVGAGWTELDFLLRDEFNWRGRYMPLDAGMFHIDLNTWSPDHQVEHIAALEILEHLEDPERLLIKLLEGCTKSLTISVPNPETVDVFGIDETHISLPDRNLFERHGMYVTDSTFYGGVWSNGQPDALFAHLVK